MPQDTDTVPALRWFVGIDIGAKTIVVRWRTQAGAPSPTRSFANGPTGLQALQAHLTTAGCLAGQTLVALEATGSYWVTTAVTLHAAGYAVAVLNPATVHFFAASKLQRAKTDAVDAATLAAFAAERQPAAWTPPPAVYHELRQRLRVRDALIASKTAMQHQLHAIQQWPVAVPAATQPLTATIAELDQRIESLTAAIGQVLQQSAWGASTTLLLTIPGIGVITAAVLQLTTCNCTLCPSAEAAAAYAGLVPFPHESGTSVKRRPRIGHGGNARLRTALYMATVSACRCNPVLAPAYARLRAAGKHSKVARCAIARKLLHIAWAVVTKQQPFTVPPHQHAPALPSAS